MTYTPERNYGCRLREYVYRGFRTITLENEVIRVTILVDKGTDIVEFLHKPTDTDFLWKSPQGLRNPALLVRTTPGSGNSGAFMDYYEGGWQEIFPSGGPAHTHRGIEFGVHGEVCLMPWEFAVAEDQPERVAVKVWVRTYRTPFYLEKTLSLERYTGILSITEKAVNDGEETLDLMWGHHPAFGWPFLDENCVVDVAPAKVLTTSRGPQSRVIDGKDFHWPTVPARADVDLDLSVMPAVSSRAHDFACLYDLSEGWYAITNASKHVGFGMAWPRDIFRYIWYWLCAGARYGPPFFGRAYTLAIEPWSTYPDNLAKAAQEGTSLVLNAGESLEVELKAVAYQCDGRVAKVTRDGQIVKS